MSQLFYSMRHLPSPLPFHDLVTIVDHAIVDTIAIIANVLLLFAVILRSPASLRFVTPFHVVNVLLSLKLLQSSANELGYNRSAEFHYYAVVDGSVRQLLRIRLL